MRPRSIRWRVRLRSWMLVFAVLGAECIPPAKDPASSSPGTSTTIVLVRHAERDPGEGVPLNAEGLVRREALKDALSENGITAIYCTDTLRNRQTVEPLSELLGLEIHLVSPLGYLDAPGVANQLVQEFLTQHAGGTILFCGNVGSISARSGSTPRSTSGWAARAGHPSAIRISMWRSCPKRELPVSSRRSTAERAVSIEAATDSRSTSWLSLKEPIPQIGSSPGPARQEGWQFSSSLG